MTFPTMWFELSAKVQIGSAVAHGRVLDSRPHQCHCVVSLSKNINPSLVLVQPRKTRPFIAERLLMGCKESIKKRAV